MVPKSLRICKKLRFSIRRVLRSRYGRGRHATRAAYTTKFMTFVRYLDQVGVGDLKNVTQSDFGAAATLLAKDVAQGRYKVTTGHNLLSAANIVFEGIGLKVWVSPAQYLGRRNHIRTEVPSGMDGQTVAACLEDLRSEGLARPAATTMLCRALGLRVREAALADTPRMLQEVVLHGRVNVQEGTKGGRKTDRWIEATPSVVEALEFARDQSPPGSRNLLAGDETYIGFIRTEVMRARPLLKEHGINNFQDLRAACFCARYAEITARAAPVIAGRNPDREQDLAAREIIGAEAGHNRVDVVGAYIGGRR